MTWLHQPLVALDTETTGTDPETDRVVQIAAGWSEGVGYWLCRPHLVNPGVPIPAEVTAVHGITDEMVADRPGPEESLRLVRMGLERAADQGHPVVGHNLAFDLTLLDRECRRHLGEPLPEGLIVLDTLVLFWRFSRTTGSRTLSKLAERHGIIFPAHDAGADALASLRLLHILAEQDDTLALIPAKALHEAQIGWDAQRQEQAAARAMASGGEARTIRPWPFTPLGGVQ